ncbi:hypothetical protein scyTo_0023704, partial [Scyliorhinus torazame]|nr:hypothetical protein [Scyliorhinus torazame]
VTDNMSDSENEEPVKRVATRQWGSGGNSKLHISSSGRFASLRSANMEENRSLSTPMENNQSRRPTPRSDSKTKVPMIPAGPHRRHCRW